MASNMEEEIKVIIKECLEESNGIDNVGYEEELFIYGFDSLVFMKVVASVEMKYGFDFDFQDLDMSKFRTIKDIAEYVKSKV